jgi:hypothetical protein
MKKVKEDRGGMQRIDVGCARRTGLVHCHGRGRGFEPVVPAINLKKRKGLWQVAKSRITSEGAGEGAKGLSAFFIARFFPLQGC